MQLDAKSREFEVRLKSEDSRYQGASSAELQDCREKLRQCEESLHQREDELRESNEKLAEVESTAETRRLELKKKAEMKIGSTKKQLAAQFATQAKEYQERIKQLDGEREKAVEERQASLGEADELKTQVSTLEAQVKKLKSEAASQKAMLEAELMNLKHSREQKEDELVQLQEMKHSDEQSLRTEIESLSTALAKEEEKSRSLAENFQLSEDSRLTLEKTLSEREASSQKMASEIEDLRASLAKTEKEKREISEEVASEREENENQVKVLKSKVKVSERAVQKKESEWASKFDEILVQANTDRIKLVEEHEAKVAALVEERETIQQQFSELHGNHEQLQGELSRVREQQDREEGEIGKHAREMESRASELEKLVNELRENFDSEKSKLLGDLSSSETEKKSVLDRIQELETQLSQVHEECDRKVADAVRQGKREGEEKGERDEEVEALRRRVDELTGAAAQIMRLESTVRDQRHTLRSQESELQKLIEENSQLQVLIQLS